MSDPKKAPLDLVPLRSLVGVARVLAHGNTKVIDGKRRAPGDFIERPLDGVFFASYLRHTMELQLLNGTVTKESLAARDKDTDLPTIDHAICNLLIMRTMLIRDGLLPEDPGPGRVVSREAAAEFFKAAETPPDGWQSLRPREQINCRCAVTARHTREAGPVWEPPCTVDNPCPGCVEGDKQRGETNERR